MRCKFDSQYFQDSETLQVYCRIVYSCFYNYLTNSLYFYKVKYELKSLRTITAAFTFNHLVHNSITVQINPLTKN